MTDFTTQLASFGSSDFTELRPAQAGVLNKYESLRESTRDIGIELPTGAGKTLIALLIADLALERGKRVAYLTGTRQLANQVLSQAESLPGFDARHFYGKNYPAADLLAYNQAQALGVMNYWVYFNAAPKVEPADLLLFDDAHLAEQSLANMYTLRIARDTAESTALYQAVCDAINQIAPGVYPLLPALRDGSVPRTTPPELISFLDWHSAAPTVSDLIEQSTYVKSDSSAHFAWNAIKANATRCGVLVGPSAIEIRPYHIPTQVIPGYAKARERVYLSATLGQPGDIQRRLGTMPVSTIKLGGEEQTPLPSHGKRAFLINPGSSSSLDGEAWAFAMEQVELAGRARGGRVAWLCASTVEADQIEHRLAERGLRVVRLKPGDDNAVDRWQKMDFAHLVTAGRFDGLDFPDDVCRLVFLPSLPAASTEFERFVVAYLGDAAYMRYRIGQRLTQALGRANRTPNDSALYIGLDAAFGTALADPSVQAALGPDVRDAVAKGLQLHGGSWATVKAAASQFWAELGGAEAPQTPEVQEGGRRKRPGRQPAGLATVDSASHEVAAATRLWLGDIAGASNSAAQAAELLEAAGELEHAAFWKYVQAHSHFVGRSAEQERLARDALSGAVSSAPQTAWFVRLQRTIEAMDGATPGDASLDTLFLAWDEWIREAGAQLLQSVAKGRQHLLSGGEKRLDAIATLGRLCGAEVRRYGQLSRSGVRWAWAGAGVGHLRVWLASDEPAAVPREDVNELLGVVMEEETLHPRSEVSGCLVIEAGKLTEPAALAASNTRIGIVGLETVVALYDKMAERFVEYVSASGTGTATERGSARVSVEVRLPKGEWLSNLTAARGSAIVGAAEVHTLFAPLV